MSTITDLIEETQALQQRYAELLEAVTQHNLAEDAHPWIREKIQDLVESDVMWTRSQIRSLIQSDLEVFQNTLNTTLDGIRQQITELDESNEELIQKVANLERTVASLTSTIDTDTSTLNGILQSIEDRYAPILRRMQDAYQLALDQNNATLADQYIRTIQSTLDQKKDEMLAAIDSWRQAHTNNN